jgi:hypothetical protein
MSGKTFAGRRFLGPSGDSRFPLRKQRAKQEFVAEKFINYVN